MCPDVPVFLLPRASNEISRDNTRRNDPLSQSALTLEVTVATMSKEEDQQAVAKRVYDAAKKGNATSIQRLLKDVCPDLVSDLLLSVQFGKYQRTALHAACRKGHLEAVKVLLRAKSNLESKDKCGRTALHVAIIKRQEETVKIEMVRVLLESGANLESKDKYGQTPLIAAINLEQAETVKMEMVEVLLEQRSQFGG